MDKSNAIPGDYVEVEMTPYDLDRGRIVYRYKKRDKIREPGLSS